MKKQTCENQPRDSRIFVGFSIDSVRAMWQNTAVVAAMFRKTNAFPAKYLAPATKTKRPRPTGIGRGPTTRVGGSHGY
jgi:hypothetical protein